MLPPVGALALARSWRTSPGGRYPAGTVILFSMSNEKTDCIATCTGRELVLLVFLIAYVNIAVRFRGRNDAGGERQSYRPKNRGLSADSGGEAPLGVRSKSTFIFP